MNLEAARALLGLASSSTEDDLKKAYRARALELHPDCQGSSLEAHWEMLELNQAHNLLREEFRRRSGSRQDPLDSEEDYNVYKRAVGYFQRIHPSIWIKTTEAGLFDRSGNQERIPVTEGILEALGAMNTAFVLFSQVVNDFPRSVWRADASAKLAQLEKMAARYKTMLKNAE